MKIYLAIPYTGIEEESFNVANKVAAKLMSEGHIVFSPISHTHPIALAGNLPKGWDYWKTFDECFIEWCDELHIVQMKIDGDAKIARSTGVNAEIEIAKRLGKPMFNQYEE